MGIFGIDFVPLSVTLKSRLEALSAGLWYVLFIGSLPFGLFITMYILIFTKYWPFMTAYLFWIWVIDKDVGETGGRPSNWVQSWSLFKYTANYFPITVKAVPGFQLDPKRNYLCCNYPHGYLPIGAAIAFSTNGNQEVKLLMPHHSIRIATLNQNFFLPIARDYILAIGGCSSSPKSLNGLLSNPGGGKIVGLSVGGVAEAFHCQANEYRLVLKNRKGFVKLALKNGSPIVPTFAFGQNNCFKLKVFPKGSIVQLIQQILKKITGVAFPIIYGRGLFQYNFGWIPFQKPINIVVGAPIEVPKKEQPTQEDIDNIHQIFIEKLTEIYNQYKYEYEEDPENCTLVIS